MSPSAPLGYGSDSWMKCIARISGSDTLHSECKARFHLGALRQPQQGTGVHILYKLVLFPLRGSGGKVPNRKPGSFCMSNGSAKICPIIRNL